MISATDTLLERARTLAHPPAPDVGPQLDLLHVELGADRYAFDARFVRRISKRAQVLALPGLSRAFAGVARIDGEFVTVADLRFMLGVEAPSGSVAVVLGRESAELAVLVSGATEIVGVSIADLPKASGQIIVGLCRNGAAFLDVAALLDDPRLTLSSHSHSTENAS